MRAQPAAVEAAVAVGHRHEGDHQQHAGQDGAQHDIQRHLRGVDAMLGELVDAERPAMVQQPQLRFGFRSKRSRSRRRREQEEREEADLRKARGASAAGAPCAAPAANHFTASAKARSVIADHGAHHFAERARGVGSSVSASTMAAWQASRSASPPAPGDAAITSSRVLAVSSRSWSVRRRSACASAPGARGEPRCSRSRPRRWHALHRRFG